MLPNYNNEEVSELVPEQTNKDRRFALLAQLQILIILAASVLRLNQKEIMKISILFVVLLAVALLVEEGQCWGRRRRRRRRRSGSKFFSVLYLIYFIFFVSLVYAIYISSFSLDIQIITNEIKSAFSKVMIFLY